MKSIDYVLVDEIVRRSRDGYLPDHLDNAVSTVRRLRRAFPREGCGQLLQWAHQEAVEVFSLTEEEFFLAWTMTAPRRPTKRAVR